MTARNRYRRLLRRLSLALFVVLVFAGVAWDESGGGSKHLGTDLAIGAGAGALISGSWWLAKRFVASSRRAFRQGYQDALALESRHARRLADWMTDTRRRVSDSEHREEMVRDVARRAGRIAGSTRRAFRDGYGGKSGRDG
ncbi:MAG TPA: hypothetical protein VED59_02860 [Acidimicrobiales bacterium]|nr:hypothetical protein [Acidimicrobiales bacterium]